MAAAALTQTAGRIPGIASLLEKATDSKDNSLEANRKKNGVAAMHLDKAAAEANRKKNGVAAMDLDNAAAETYREKGDIATMHFANGAAEGYRQKDNIATMQFANSATEANRKQRNIATMHLANESVCLSPEDVAKTPDEKHLGASTANLGVKDFKLIRILGTGTFARVWLVKLSNPRPGEEKKVFALKVLRKAEVIKLKQVDHVNHERAILGDVAGHPFITTLLTTFSDSECLYMLLDYCPGGEVFSYLRRQRRFSENVARFYIAEIVLILEFLHEREGVAYRDLKPENILLDASGHVKLVDFGFAKRVRDHETYTLCGTPEYLAPEVIQSQGHTAAVDWWALGILMYEFITGYPPFWHQSPMEIYKQILHKPIAFPNQDPPISPEAKDLILALCTVDRSNRLGNLSGGAAGVKAHPFFATTDWDAVYARRADGPIIPQLRDAADDSCFETYSEDEGKVEVYTLEAREKWDRCFDGF